MIGRLEGVYRDGLIEVAGVGYRVNLVFEPQEGQQIAARIYTHWTDGGPMLYGFLRREEEDMFTALVRIQGVGPSAAAALISGLGAEGVASAVRGRRIDTLSSVRGIGRRGAERILLSCQVPDHIDGDSLAADVTSALQQLGWSADRAQAAATWACSKNLTDEAELLKVALRWRPENPDGDQAVPPKQ